MNALAPLAFGVLLSWSAYAKVEDYIVDPAGYRVTRLLAGATTGFLALALLLISLR